jgi:hypothetical protein
MGYQTGKFRKSVDYLTHSLNLVPHLFQVLARDIEMAHKLLRIELPLKGAEHEQLHRTVESGCQRNPSNLDTAEAPTMPLRKLHKVDQA